MNRAVHSSQLQILSIDSLFWGQFFNLVLKYNLCSPLTMSVSITLLFASIFARASFCGYRQTLNESCYRIVWCLRHILSKTTFFTLFFETSYPFPESNRNHFLLCRVYLMKNRFYLYHHLSASSWLGLPVQALVNYRYCCYCDCFCCWYPLCNWYMIHRHTGKPETDIHLKQKLRSHCRCCFLDLIELSFAFYG